MHLILIKHSIPEIIRETLPEEWHLSSDGRKLCQPLAQQIAPYAPGVILSSVEPKALETAQAIASELKRPCYPIAGLHEHNRSNEGWMERTRFETRVSQFFQSTGELVLGLETAGQARARFSEALEPMIKAFAQDGLAVVSHGTVISLYVAYLTGMAPMPLWKRLECPSYIVISLKNRKVEKIVEQVE